MDSSCLADLAGASIVRCRFSLFPAAFAVPADGNVASTFLAMLTASFLLINALFAVAFLLCGPGALQSPPTDAPEGRFLQAFFFSVETFATIGYGNIYPIGATPNMLMMLESLIGPLGVALATGIIFARFSRPNAQIRFSNVAFIAPYRGITAFEFLIANERSSQRPDSAQRGVLGPAHGLRRNLLADGAHPLIVQGG
jgi:hypothetical protein